MQLISGQKVQLSQLFSSEDHFSIEVKFKADFELDISSFALGTNDQLYHDDYMTFYNQPHTPNKEVQYSQKNAVHIFNFDLTKINLSLTPSFVICATVAHEQSLIKNIQQGFVNLINRQGQIVGSFVLDASHFDKEKAVMLIEIYFKNDAWRIAAVGQGFNGGLKALVKHFGGEVAEEVTSLISNSNSNSNSNSQSHENNIISKMDLKKKVVLDKIEKTSPHLVDLAKKSLISLEKSNLLDVKARVALVLDFSGSMLHQYKKGDVQKVIDRIMPLALNFDDDGHFECWAFAEKALRLNDIGLNNLSNYINEEKGGFKKWNAGAGYNNEPVVLETVLHYFTQHSPSNLPVFVVFISDGGVSEARKIKKILQEASVQPLFWQFVGIGGRNYGVLEKLDTMDGRVIDNCNFFEIDNIQSIPESQLYDLLLKEFPLWIKAAKDKNILRG
ncbi:tellurium resistance protein [Acinetobacter sp. 194]|uniref:VWA domain-containing protein n=1 Tax=Acinetobacter shaoyimingii TaxID=2715164 RepID=UPI001407F2A2|nr:VWA domain-containing protein [Acinetobacter shaoyimingii]NHB58544.1 tellurium resistance protein [Acinetobacter shaoyimingii]